MLLALAVRVGVVATGQYLDQRYQERHEIERVGIAFAASHTLSDPFPTPTGLTAHVSPGYPVLLGLLLRVFGTGASGELAKELLGCLITASRYALLVLMARTLAIPREIALASGFPGACVPVEWPAETLGAWEANVTGVLLLVLAAFTAQAWRQRSFNFMLGAAHGVFWGAAALFSSPVLAVEVGLAKAGVVGFRACWRRYVRFLGGMVVGTLAALAPRGVRNWVYLGCPILTRSNLGLELYVSNNDMAASRMELNGPSFRAFHPFTNARVANEIRKQGEVAFNRRYRELAFDWIRANPARFGRLTLMRVREFWFPSYFESRFKQWLLGLLTVGGFAGAALLWKSDKAAATVLWVVDVTYPLIYYVVQSSPRYRYPVNWIGLIGTVYTAAQFVRMPPDTSQGRNDFAGDISQSGNPT